jgi:hypothetical protein
MKSTIILASLVLGAAVVLSGCGKPPTEKPATAPASTDIAATGLPRSSSPAGARVYFIMPLDGSTVSSPLRVEFGLEGMHVVAAGVNEPDSGHHHLLVDTGLPELGLPIPKDEQHIHFGDGSTITELSLAPGEHTLQLLLGDHLHIPHEPPVMSGVITVIVE